MQYDEQGWRPLYLALRHHPHFVEAHHPHHAALIWHWRSVHPIHWGQGFVHHCLLSRHPAVHLCYCWALELCCDVSIWGRYNQARFIIKHLAFTIRHCPMHTWLVCPPLLALLLFHPVGHLVGNTDSLAQCVPSTWSAVTEDLAIGVMQNWYFNVCGIRRLVGRHYRFHQPMVSVTHLSVSLVRVSTIKW